MPVEVLKNAYVSINSVDLSDHVRQVTLTYEAEQEDDTAMGDTTRSNLPGLLNWSIEVEFNQDHDAGEVDATLFPLVGNAGFPIAVRRDAGAKSSINPEYGADATLVSYSPISGQVGGIHTTTARFVPARGGSGSHVLTRSTA